MQFSIAKEEMESALGACAAIASRSKETYLACVLVEAKGDNVSFSASDGDQMVRIERLSLVTDEGTALIPAGRMHGIVKSMPSGAVNVEADKDAIITSNNVVFRLPVLDPADFPNFPRVDDPQVATFDADDFVSAFSSVASFAKKPEKNDATPIFTCCRVDLSGGVAEIRATDTYRVARTSIRAEGDLSCEIPAHLVNAIASDKPCGKIEIQASKSLVSAEYDDVRRVSRRITSGTFPNTDRFFSAIPALEFDMFVDAIRNAARRMSMIDSRNRPARFSVADNVEISLAGDDAQGYREVVDADNISGEGSFKLNPRYIADMAKVLLDGNVHVRVEASNKPVRFTADNIDAVIMPVR